MSIQNLEISFYIGVALWAFLIASLLDTHSLRMAIIFKLMPIVIGIVNIILAMQKLGWIVKG